MTASILYEGLRGKRLHHNNSCSNGLIKTLTKHIVPRGKNYALRIVRSSETHHVSDSLAGYDNRVTNFALQKVSRPAVRNSPEDPSPRCLLSEIRDSAFLWIANCSPFFDYLGTFLVTAI
jgi:hypothetical protein